jgi:hypothetical protein
VEREGAEGRAKRRHPFAGDRISIVHERRHDLGEGGREPGDGSVRAVLQGLEDQGFVPDEEIEPVETVGLDRRPRRVRDLHAHEVGRGLPQAFHERHRDRVAGARRELVDVEGQPPARLSSRTQVLEQRGVVQREVRRRDHRDGVGADLLGVGGQRHGVGGRLSAGVHRDREPLGPGPDEALRDSTAFVDREQHALARRPAHERPVNTAIGQEADERADRLLVRLAPAVT